ncbi:MAG: MmcQ/YjbR family DNA-binding protein [Muribaculaceae bacterium]|nr:MmcQ/YjbR family DNA-binding protein [Muribaculaceae bacterium]
MNIEEIREYCLALPCTAEEMPFGDDVLVFKLFGKIFACISLADTDYLALKCDPEYAIELREHYPDIEPAYHWNKRHWNQHRLSGSLSDELLHSLIRHSYSRIIAGLPRKTVSQFPEVLEIN